MAGTQRHPDWDEQRERLSAYLDGELTAEEAHALEAHLPTCPDCQAALASLRSVHTLLAAMPQVRAPRSFTLPVAAPAAPRPAATPRLRPAWYPLTQWAGGLAASVGLAMVIGSSLLGGMPRGAMAPALGTSQNTAASGAQATRAPYASDSAPTQASKDQSAYAATPTPTGVATPTAPERASNANVAAQEADPRAVFFPLGAGLLAGGAGIFVAGRLASRRRR
jgi:anti-sigma factor RsiW